MDPIRVSIVDPLYGRMIDDDFEIQFYDYFKIHRYMCSPKLQLGVLSAQSVYISLKEKRDTSFVILVNRVEHQKSTRLAAWPFVEILLLLSALIKYRNY